MNDPGHLEPATEHLHDIFEKWGTDKGPHADAYELMFAGRRSEVTRVLEVGIGTLIPAVNSSMLGYGKAGYRPGGSLKAWRDFFPNAHVTGFDVQPDTQLAGENRIRTFLCDSTDRAQVEAALADAELAAFDLVVDDGSHVDSDQLLTLRNLLPYVRPLGFYVVEDVLAGSSIDKDPQILRPVIGGNPFVVVPVSAGGESWKIIIIRKMPA
jgi:hypothetical protein